MECYIRLSSVALAWPISYISMQSSLFYVLLEYIDERNLSILLKPVGIIGSTHKMPNYIF